MINKSSGIPVYKQIETSIRTDISRGVYPVGAKLPSEDDIANEFGVSRGTVRQALSALANQGIVKRIHGNGTFVCESGNECKIETDHFISFLDGLERTGAQIDTTILDKNLTMSDDVLGELFPVNTELYAIKRLRKRDEKPIMFSVDHIPCDIAPDIADKYNDCKSIYEFLENEYGIRISKVKRIFYAVTANRDMASTLSIKKGDPLFYIIQQAYDEYSRCVDCAFLYIISEKMHFSIMTSR